MAAAAAAFLAALKLTRSPCDYRCDYPQRTATNRDGSLCRFKVTVRGHTDSDLR